VGVASMSEAPPSPPQAPDEAPLVARARERDPDAFEQLIAAQAPQLQRMLRRVLVSPSDAEEVLQETFLKAWRAIERFRGEARFSTWLYRIALNEARRRQAYDAHRRALPIDDVMLDLPDLSAGPALLAESAEFQGFIEQCVSELPANYREAVILRDVEGLSNEEAAAVLELNLRNFKSRLHRGRMAIRRRVEEQYGR
jgi:RNA polymerase sigma-70 factor, ECF subfamily